MPRSPDNRPSKPLDAAALERLALRYVERYATTRAKLGAYLRRKIAERGWDGGTEAPVEAIVGRFAERGYVDDRGFASARAAALTRRGYGAARISLALRAAGIAEEDSRAARSGAALSADDAAMMFARRKRIGPFAAGVQDRDRRRRALAAMLRAGHPYEIARKIVEADPGEEPESGASYPHGR